LTVRGFFWRFTSGDEGDEGELMDRHALWRPQGGGPGGGNMKHPEPTNLPNGATIITDGHDFSSSGAPNMLDSAHKITSDPCMMTDAPANLSNGVNKRPHEHAV
jgi:hypothetical protein